MWVIHVEATTLAADPTSNVDNIAQFGIFDPLANIAFALLFYSGLKYRHDVQLHSRYMLATLLFVIANALILKHVLTDEQIPQHIANAMLSAGFGPVMFLIVVNIILLIGGQFMEPSGLLVIVAPLVFPIAIELGIDPIHLGIIMVVNMEIGMITPPVGLNLFVTSGVAGMPMMSVVRAALPFLAVLYKHHVWLCVL